MLTSGLLQQWSLEHLYALQLNRSVKSVLYQILAFGAQKGFPRHTMQRRESSSGMAQTANVEELLLSFYAIIQKPPRIPSL
jgi:hypothetical protein